MAPSGRKTLQTNSEKKKKKKPERCAGKRGAHATNPDLYFVLCTFKVTFVREGRGKHEMSPKRPQELRGDRGEMQQMSPKRPQELRGDRFLFLTHLLYVRESERERERDVVGSCGRSLGGGGVGLQF